MYRRRRHWFIYLSSRLHSWRQRPGINRTSRSSSLTGASAVAGTCVGQSSQDASQSTVQRSLTWRVEDLHVARHTLARLLYYVVQRISPGQSIAFLSRLWARTLTSLTCRQFKLSKKYLRSDVRPSVRPFVTRRYFVNQSINQSI